MYSVTPGDLYAAGVILPCLGTIAVALRFYCRYLRANNYGTDDWMALVAAIFTWFFGIVVITGTAVGAWGGHTPIDPATGKNVSTKHETDASKLNLVVTVIFMPTYCLIKLSVLFLYKRIFTTRRFQILSILMVAFIVCWTLAFLFSKIFQCGAHVDSGWKGPAAIAKYCDNYAAQELAYAITDVITDVAVIVMPVPLIWKMDTTVAQKFGVTCTFLLGFFSTAAACVRLHFVSIYMFGTKLGLRDWVGFQSVIVIWSLVEAGVGVCAVCLPTLRPLFIGRSVASVIEDMTPTVSREVTPEGTRRLPGSSDSGESETSTLHASTDLDAVSRHLRNGDVEKNVSTGETDLQARH